jgi:hypothetical protein
MPCPGQLGERWQAVQGVRPPDAPRARHGPWKPSSRRPLSLASGHDPRACKPDVAALCKDVCKIQEGEVCGGKVLSCLTERVDDINNAGCRKEVMYFMRMESEVGRLGGAPSGKPVGSWARRAQTGVRARTAGAFSAGLCVRPHGIACPAIQTR